MSPIRPENKDRYPKNWSEIRSQILIRADHRCEFCGARNYMPHHITKSRVVLTVAHLDHTPENNGFANLRALCQRCHNEYDREHRLKNRRERAEREKNQLKLFEVQS